MLTSHAEYHDNRLQTMSTMSIIGQIFVLLVVFQMKHYIADFPLQRKYMLRKSRPGWDFLIPLVIHCGVHATITLTIVSFVNPKMWWLAVVDFVVHFTMDRIKSGPRYLGRFDDLSKPAFWNILGFDQMVHHLTNYFIIWQLIMSLQNTA